ncbi:hypothetical protein GCM10022393_07110 [Aquimarina addita]|uniref:Secretion system C-terminal sorting domain-containing protein n=1 Tax=Aquimarina addita TaxID=870485 RepID=A0ABP7XCH8_9FLAO
MYLNLHNFRKGFLAFFTLCLCSTINAQTPKTTQQNIKKGHALYKQIKMFDSKKGSATTKIERVADDAVDRANYEFERLKDPNTGKIPDGIRKAEFQFSSKIALGTDVKNAVSNGQQQKSNSNFSYWTKRGPFNVGGRTRALAIDYTNENVILAGGVSGGLWRSENNGETWRKITRSFQNPSITGIIQDPRPSQSNTWYYISGERYGNSASAGGAFYQGTGIYKSQDGGRTFENLRSTNDEDPGSFSSLDLLNSIAINPVNGEVYVGSITGIQRSTDGGNSFTEVLSGGFDAKAEVVVTSTGILYATLDSDSDPGTGFFTSSDGINWTNITPVDFVPDFGRTVIEIDPSDESIVYFLSQNNSGIGTAALLNKYNSTPTDTEEIWIDLSSNLPFGIGGSVGNLNLQGEYNMVLEVHPTDSNIIFVGGTNIYRSTTGFTTPTGQDSWIAGYSPLNNVSLYTNQHPDQHAFLFYPSNPNKVLSGNDGGVYVTEDILATNPGVEPVTWVDLNNGYLTTQPYHVAFDPEPNTDDLVAGFQDNGTWFTNSTETNAVWEEDFGGDGTYSAIADGGLTRYVSSQRGNVFRFNFDEEGTFESFSAVEPAAAGGFSFVNPFVLDPNNDNIMYMPALTTIWRNNDLDGLPLFTNGAATENWVNITASNTPDGSTITSLDISKYPVANILYYGTNSGLIFKIDNANIDDQIAEDLATGKGLPVGTVNDINVDPSNSDRVVITFSNYGIPSLFITENGGESWTDISGNLEENRDGTGTGPSVRSTAFLGASRSTQSNGQTIFAATSTGLYYTNRLNGQNTVWRKENNVIGDAVADEVATRKDGFIALAVHGNGLFSARLPVITPLPEASLTATFLLNDIFIDEGESQEISIDITDLFVQSEGLPIEIELTNSNPELVTVTRSDETLLVSYAGENIGQAAIGLIASSGEEQVSEGFTVTVSEPSIYEQTNAIISSLPSQNFLDFGAVVQAADDFTIPEGNVWNVDRIIAFGGANGTPIFDSVSIEIYEDTNGIPGASIYNSGAIAPVSELDSPTLSITLPEAVRLESGNYWISIYVNVAFDGENQWFWSSQNNEVGAESQWIDVANLFGVGATEWIPASVALGRDPLDQTFQIFGDIEDVGITPNGAEINEQEPLAVLTSEISSLVWPNPSSDQFTFSFEALDLGERISIQIFDISGKLIHNASNLDVKENHLWNASNMNSGFYFVNLSSDVSSKSFKIIKN